MADWDAYVARRVTSRQAGAPEVSSSAPNWDDYVARRRSQPQTMSAVDDYDTDAPSGSLSNMDFGDYAALASRVGLGIGGSILGSAAGPIGTVALGALGGAAGEWLAQQFEKTGGRRADTNLAQVGVQGLINALPIGKVAKGVSTAGRMLRRGVQGAALNVPAAELTERAESGEWLSPELQADRGTLMLAGMLGFGGGAALGGVEGMARRGGRAEVGDGGGIPPGAGGGVDDAARKAAYFESRVRARAGTDDTARKAAYFERRAREAYDTSPVDPSTITYGGASSPNAKGEGVTIPREPGSAGPIVGDWRPWHGSRSGRYTDTNRYRQEQPVYDPTDVTPAGQAQWSPQVQGPIEREVTTGMAGSSRSQTGRTPPSLWTQVLNDPEPFADELLPPQPLGPNRQGMLPHEPTSGMAGLSRSRGVAPPEPAGLGPLDDEWLPLGPNRQGTLPHEPTSGMAGLSRSRGVSPPEPAGLGPLDDEGWPLGPNRQGTLPHEPTSGMAGLSRSRGISPPEPAGLGPLDDDMLPMGPGRQGTLPHEPTSGMAGLSRSRANAPEAIPQDFDPFPDPFTAPPEPFRLGRPGPGAGGPGGGGPDAPGGMAPEPFEVGDDPIDRLLSMFRDVHPGQRPRMTVPMGESSVQSAGADMLTPGRLDLPPQGETWPGMLSDLDAVGGQAGKVSLETPLTGQVRPEPPPVAAAGPDMPPGGGESLEPWQGGSGKAKVPAGLVALREFLKPMWEKTLAETGVDMSEDLPAMFQRIVAHARDPKLRRNLMGRERKLAEQWEREGILPPENIVATNAVDPQPPARRVTPGDDSNLPSYLRKRTDVDAAEERAAIAAESEPPPPPPAETVRDWMASYFEPPPRTFSELTPQEQREFRRIWHELDNTRFSMGQSVEELEDGFHRAGEAGMASSVRGDSNPNLLPISPNAPIYHAIADASGKRRTARQILTSMADYEAGKRPTSVTADVLKVIRRMLAGHDSQQFYPPSVDSPSGMGAGDRLKRMMPPDAGDIPIDPKKRYAPDPDTDFPFGANSNTGDEGFVNSAMLAPLGGAAVGGATGAAADDDNRFRGGILGMLAGLAGGHLAGMPRPAMARAGAGARPRASMANLDTPQPMQATRGRLDLPSKAMRPGLFGDLDAVGGQGGKVSLEGPMAGQDDVDSLLAQLGVDDATLAGMREVDPSNARLNASGESSASLEALSRQSGMRSRGEQFVVYDRTGQRRPLIGPDAVDYRVRAGETYGVEGPDGFRILDDQGGRVPSRVSIGAQRGQGPEDVSIPGLEHVRQQEHPLPEVANLPFSLQPSRSTPPPVREHQTSMFGNELPPAAGPGRRPSRPKPDVPGQGSMFRDDEGFVNPELLAPLAGAAAGGAIGPMLDDDPTVGGVGGAATGAMAGLLATPAGRRALIQARYGNMLSYMAVPKSLIGNVAGIGAHAWENKGTAGPIARSMFSRETLRDIPRQWRSGQFRENAPTERTSSLNMPGRVMGTGDQVAQGILRRAGALPDAAEEVMLTNMPRSHGLRKLQEGLTSGDAFAQLARLAVPFSKTAFNQLERGVERLPGLGGTRAIRSMSNPSDAVARRRQIGGALAMAGGAGVGSQFGEDGALEDYKYLLPFIAPLLGPYALPGIMGMAGGLTASGEASPTEMAGDVMDAVVAQLPIPEAWTLQPENIIRSSLPYGGLGRHLAPVAPNELETQDSLFAPALAQYPFLNEFLLDYRRAPRQPRETPPRW